MKNYPNVAYCARFPQQTSDPTYRQMVATKPTSDINLRTYTLTLISQVVPSLIIKKHRQWLQECIITTENILEITRSAAHVQALASSMTTT